MDLFNNFVSIHASLANNWAVNKPFTDFKKVYNSFRREVLYCILIEFGIIMKLLRLIKMHLNEMCSKVCIHKYLSDTFPFQKSLKQGYPLSPLLSNFALVYAIRRPKQTTRKGM
jgi:Reverse transcriptase (RNA-dependent DNA polymerase).